MRAVFVVLVLSQVAPFATLACQRPPLVERGARIRLTAPRVGIEKSVGTYLSVTDGSMQFQPAGREGPWTIPTLSITELEVSRGREANVRKGALLGGAVGAGLGALAGAMIGHAQCYQGDQCVDPVRALAVGALVGVAAFGTGGLVAGTLVGALSESDAWEQVSLRQLELGQPPRANRRLALGLSLSF